MMAQPPNSTSSTTATPPSDSNNKRTRDQPNLSECHSCLTRINHTCNPDERLQPLPSLWRIVLLCKKCIKNISHTCTYCLKPITALDNDNNNNNNITIVTCNLCNCKIHLNCVSSFKDSAPWRYLKGEFSVCVDCWVPDSLKSSVRGMNGNGDGRLVKNRKYLLKGNEFMRRIQTMDDAELAVQFHRVFSSFPRIERSEFGLDPIDLNVWKIRCWGGISYKRSRFRKECGEGLENDLSRGRENGVTSEGNGVKIGLLTYKRDKKRKVCKIDNADVMMSESGSIQSGDKYELQSCSTDVSDALLCVDADKGGSPVDGGRYVSETFIRVNDGVDVDRFGEKLAIYKRSRFRRKGQVDGTLYESGECRVCDNHECTCKTEHRLPDDENDMTRFIVECEGNGILTNGSCNTDGEKLAIYKRSRFRRKGQVDGTLYESGECRVCDNHECTCKTEHRRPNDENDMTRFIVECEGSGILTNGSCNTEQDRYHLKYFKRVATTKPCSSRLHSGTVGCENKSPESALSNSETDSSSKCDDELRLPNECGDAGLDRYSLKYVKRVKGSESGLNTVMKLHSDTIQPQS